MSTQSPHLLSETITPKDYHRRAIVVVGERETIIGTVTISTH